MSDVIFKSNNPLRINEGTGVSLTKNDIGGNLVLDGSDTSVVKISIGQAVSTSSNVQFDVVSLSSNSLTIGTGSNDVLVFNDGSVAGDLKFNDKGTITEDLNTIGNLIYQGVVSSSNFETDLSSATHSVQTGSTKWGELSSQKQFFTGSLNVSSSFKLNGYEVNEISNDTSLTDQSRDSLITEYAAYQYLVTTSPVRSYLRKSFVHTGSFVDSSTIRFSAITASAPTIFTSTSENDFMFFINGMLI